KHERRDPLKTMGKINSAMPGIVQRNRTNVLHVLFIFVVASEVAFVVGIDDAPIAWIGHDEAAFSTTGHEPIFASDHARIAAAGDTDIRVVLLRAVNVVRERIVYSDMIKLSSRLVILSGPVFATVRGDAGPAVIRICNAVWVRRINPESVMISVARCQQIESLSTID